MLVNYLEEKAKQKSIKNIIAEVTFDNVYSLNNLEELEYKNKLGITW